MRILISLLFLIPFLVNSQEINDSGNGYTAVIQIDSLSKKEIYTRAKEWIALNYRSANDVIQLDTEDQLIVKGNLEITSNTKYNIKSIYNHTLIIAFKEGKYKLDLIFNSTSIKNPPADPTLANGTKISTPDLTKEIPLPYKFLFQISGDRTHITEEEIKNNFVNGMQIMVSEKKALKIWEKNKEDLLNPDSEQNEQSKFIYNQLDVKTGSIFKSLENYIVNKKKNDDW